jgi:uncharacterized membrane protein
VVWAPLILWRAHLESNLWIDETYSLALVSHPVSRVLELTAVDSHPPGYYLALKSWLKLARLAGHEPGIFWARSLNVLAWLALALAAWVGGRRIAGRGAGTLIAWMVAGGAFAALHARDLRSYALATLGVFVTCVAMLEILRGATRREGDGEGAAPPPAALWAIAATGTLVALWCHLLSAVALASFGLCWLAAWVGGRRIAGRGAGTLIAWMVAGGAFAALHARDLRSYALATLGVFVTCLALLEILRIATRREGDGEGAAPPPAALWAIVATGTLVALWCHLLSAVALASFGLCWLVAWWLATGPGRGAGRRLPALGAAAIAAAVVLLGFLPWLVRVARQASRARGRARGAC